MEELVDWLKEIEQLACDFYTQAAEVFSEDKQLSNFLSQLAQDEKSHTQLMTSIADYLQDNDKTPASDITLDHKTKEHLENPLREFYDFMGAGKVSKKQLFECIAKTEFSEWNDIFLYVVNTFKEQTREFEYMTAEIQAHKDRIQSFLDNLPSQLKPSLDIRALPHVWQSKFLIVEDYQALRDMVAAFIAPKGVVETAQNGKEGLRKTKEHFFDAIISDIQMPVMDGFEFYTKAVEQDPRVRGHFLFYSFEITPQIEAFLRKNNLRFLRKPFDPYELVQVIANIVLETREKM